MRGQNKGFLASNAQAEAGAAGGNTQDT